ncbi:uncharacterized protein LOC127906041 isoform X1 [Oncorhynchus keta]|uniref:uncharacterized protein LOC127906041 isoform X1 n=1 Tax=Oncorhynchus keta TaxID=8018 RepID=UPI00227D5EC8|nr:uncharacterized protein LOC127906041 isoform X1 [Oncorhynchus keta]XP_052363041.1 uncharacterized protein LOC127906041 isoform X2 [Oncorhynchus keta]XP_052363042.1 uncharacterized protein LOC127906041 isoform X1 [Oncorhynchus keta]
MSHELAFRCRVTSIMEALTATVVQEICQFMGESYAALRVEMLHEQNKKETRMEKPANCRKNFSKPVSPPSLGNFPIVGQVLNKQEANYHWLEDGAVFEGLASPVTERQEPSQPPGQITDTVPWPVWLIKQEEMADDDLESEGYGEWIPETPKASQNITGESDEEERSKASGGSRELGLDDFKREQSPLLVSAEDAVTPIKTKYKARMLEHTGKPRFRCDICGEKFQRQSGLTRHQRHKHNTVKTYSCTVCGKGFTYIKSLSTHELTHSDVSISSTITLDEAKARKRGLTDEPTDRNAARDMISAILHSKPGGEKVFQEYGKTKGLTDSTRRLMVNIIVADMMENHGRIPPSSVRTNYALGIVTLFPYLNDPDSEHGYEKYYDAASGSGYLAWRIKTVGRNTSCKTKKRTKPTYQNGPKAQRSCPSAVEQLSGDECKEAISVLQHTTTNESLVREKMMATFQYRQQVVHDPGSPQLS